MSEGRMLPVPIDGIEEDTNAWIHRAATLVIQDQETLDRAGLLLSGVKALIAEVERSCGPIIAKAHRLHADLVAQRKGFKLPLLAAEKVIKGKVADWVSEQERKARAEALEARQSAQAAREKAEREAREFETEGDEDLAQIVREDAVEAEVAAPRPMPPPLKTTGVSTREKWTFKVEDLKILVLAVAAGKVPLNALKANDVFLGQQARSLKAEMQYPGVMAWAEKVVASR